jgi:hypothetical protein
MKTKGIADNTGSRAEFRIVVSIPGLYFLDLLEMSLPQLWHLSARD